MKTLSLQGLLMFRKKTSELFLEHYLIHFCLFVFPLEVLAVSCEDDECFVPSAANVQSLPDIVPAPLPFEGTIVGERTGMNQFLDVDTIRSLFLFTSKNKRCIEAIRTIGGEVQTLFDSRKEETFYGIVHAVYTLPDGEWIIYESRDNEASRLWKYNPDSRNLRCVFTFRNVYQRLVREWGYDYDPDSHTIYISEYGTSKDNPIDPNDPDGQRHLGYKAGATAIWQSEDMGETWSILHDFAEDGDIYYERFHIHAIHYDRYAHRLYVTTGDAVDSRGNSNKRLYWTDGDGTWQHRDFKYYWGTTNDAYSHPQMVSLFAAEDFIIAGGDDFNNGIYRINKTDTPEDMQLELVCRYDASVSGLITQYSERFVQLPDGLIVVYIGDGDGWAYPRQSRILATYDGWQWYQIFTGHIEMDAEHTLGNRETVMRWWNGHLYFTCMQRTDGVQCPVFYEMEVPVIPPITGIPDKVQTEGTSTNFTIDGRRATSEKKGIVIESRKKVIR